MSCDRAAAARGSPRPCGALGLPAGAKVQVADADPSNVAHRAEDTRGLASGQTDDLDPRAGHRARAAGGGRPGPPRRLAGRWRRRSRWARRGPTTTAGSATCSDGRPSRPASTAIAFDARCRRRFFRAVDARSQRHRHGALLPRAAARGAVLGCRPTGAADVPVRARRAGSSTRSPGRRVRGAVGAALRGCAAVPGRLAAARPFGDAGDPLRPGRGLALAMPEDEQLELIDAHPRIGAPPGSVSALSFVEQGYGTDADAAAAAASARARRRRARRLNAPTRRASASATACSSRVGRARRSCRHGGGPRRGSRR